MTDGEVVREKPPEEKGEGDTERGNRWKARTWQTGIIP